MNLKQISCSSDGKIPQSEAPPNNGFTPRKFFTPAPNQRHPETSAQPEARTEPVMRFERSERTAGIESRSLAQDFFSPEKESQPRQANLPNREKDVVIPSWKTTKRMIPKKN